METVTSRQNPRIKAVKALHSKKGRTKANRILLEGHRLVCDAIEGGSAPESVYVCDNAVGTGAPEGARLEALLRGLPAHAVTTVSPECMRALATTETPQGVAAVLPMPAANLHSDLDLQSPDEFGCGGTVLVCDGVSDPGNLGTLVRSAAASGMRGVVLVNNCADPWNPKAIRATMGASLRIPIIQCSGGVAEVLGDGGLTCASFAADARGTLEYSDVDWTQPTAIVVGSEAAGLSEDTRDLIRAGSITEISIPLAGADAAGGATGSPVVESLNAAVAGSVVMCEALRQKRKWASGGKTEQ